MKPVLFTTDQGTSIQYRIFNRTARGLPFVFAGGLAGSHLIWSALTKYLRVTNPVLIWDYPALPHGSVEGSIRKTLTVNYLARCQKAVMDHAEFASATLAGWSLGPHINAEFAALYPDSYSAIIALCGLPGASFATRQHRSDSSSTAQIFGTGTFSPRAAHWFSQKNDLLEKLKKQLNKSEHPTRWARRFGLVSPDIDELLCDAIIKEFIELSIFTYLQYLYAASTHNTRGLLAKSLKPVLVAAGDKDIFVNHLKVRRISARIADSEFLLIKGATHFAPLEYPQLLALQINDFLKRHRIK
jgi:pimeloyl-ACP methyl ester carboxylesterase